MQPSPTSEVFAKTDFATEEENRRSAASAAICELWLHTNFYVNRTCTRHLPRVKHRPVGPENLLCLKNREG